MLAALRENWKYKLLALVCALALHAYVIGQNAAGQTRTLIVPLTLRNSPPTLLADEKSLPLISVTLNGPTDDVSRLGDTSVTAFVDMSHAHAGQNGPLPVHVALPPGTDSTVAADPQPSIVPLTLQAKVKRRLPVAATEPGTSPAGYAFRSALVSPRRAAIEGPPDAVASVRQLIAKVDKGTVGTIDDQFPIVALDSDDSPVNGLTITPSTVHVHIEMVRVPVSRTLLVSPDVTGTPLFPARVVGIQVSPPTLIVTGKSERLTRIGTITTAPIDVSGATGDIVRQVACVSPPGLALIGSGMVTVTVRVAAPDAANSSPAPLPDVPLTSPAPPADTPSPVGLPR